MNRSKVELRKRAERKAVKAVEDVTVMYLPDQVSEKTQSRYELEIGTVAYERGYRDAIAELRCNVLTAKRSSPDNGTREQVRKSVVDTIHNFLKPFR